MLGSGRVRDHLFPGVRVGRVRLALRTFPERWSVQNFGEICMAAHA